MNCSIAKAAYSGFAFEREGSYKIVASGCEGASIRPSAYSATDDMTNPPNPVAE